MFRVTKHFDLCAAHQLDLPYDSPCNRLHGHNYQVSISVEADKPNSFGILVDFTALKNVVHSVLDHRNLNDVLPLTPTAENLTRWIAGVVQSYLDLDENVPADAVVTQVVVKETDGNEVVYIVDLDEELAF